MPMDWETVYDCYYNLPDNILELKINVLDSIGPGDEVVDLITHIESDALKTKLIKKAIEFEAHWTLDDFNRLDGQIPSDLFVHLAKVGDVEFGDSDEVAEALQTIFDEDGNEALYQRALKSGIKFTKEQMEDMCRWVDDEEDEDYESDDEDYVEDEDEAPAVQNNIGCLGFLLALFGAGGAVSRAASHQSSRSSYSSGGRKKHNGRCDGDCNNCPAHYGYRYGRWYYGHGHQHGCQFGGNGGAHGKCYRD